MKGAHDAIVTAVWVSCTKKLVYYSLFWSILHLLQIYSPQELGRGPLTRYTAEIVNTTVEVSFE